MKALIAGPEVLPEYLERYSGRTTNAFSGRLEKSSTRQHANFKT